MPYNFGSALLVSPPPVVASSEKHTPRAGKRALAPTTIVTGYSVPIFVSLLILHVFFMHALAFPRWRAKPVCLVCFKNGIRSLETGTRWANKNY